MADNAFYALSFVTLTILGVDKYFEDDQYNTPVFMQIGKHLCLPDANAINEIGQHKISIKCNTNVWNEIWMNRFNN